jgi:D-alanine transfer protein
VPAGLGLSILIGALIVGTQFARSIEDRYIHVLAPMLVPQSYVGSALQEAAFQQTDLLTVYGSSEMLNEASPFRSFNFFSKYPTGFQVFDVAKSGDTSLDIAEDLAALGPELKGKKLVISFTPTMFNAPEVGQKAYAADFSLLHANQLAFSPYLDLPLKQQLARRMLAYPDTLQKDPLLEFTLQRLVSADPLDHLVYSLTFPLGQLRTWIMTLQDHWAILTYIWQHPRLQPEVTRQDQNLNWSTLIDQATAIQMAKTTADPFGVENATWRTKFKNFKVKSPGSGDKAYLTNLVKSNEWGDLELALAILQKFNADPLIMSRPINGLLWQASGISPQAQDFYYQKLEGTVSAYHLQEMDFKSHDADPLFSIDQASHTSPRGWVYVDQTLDAYFHGRLH